MRSIHMLGWIASFCLILAGCGGGNGTATGRLSVGITDAPIDSAEAVVIHVTSATLHGPDGNTTIDVMDTTTGNPGRDIDLLKFQGGQWTGLFDATVTAGHYSWIRLGIDLTKSYIQINGAQFGLRCTSCDNVGYKINSSFNVTQDATLTMMLDFDLRKSVTDPNSGNQDYILRPTVRLVESAASGSISGSIDNSLINPPSGGICSVYVFAGSNATPDDIYIPIGTAIPTAQNNPITTTNVIYNINTDTYSYTASFLPAGDYTIAVTCDAASDSAATDTTLNFSDTQNATVIAGTTSIKDFPPAPPPTSP